MYTETCITVYYWRFRSLTTPFSFSQELVDRGLHVTIEELKKRTKVTDSQLDTEIEETDMIDLASHFDNIETYPVYNWD